MVLATKINLLFVCCLLCTLLPQYLVAAPIPLLKPRNFKPSTIHHNRHVSLTQAKHAQRTRTPILISNIPKPSSDKHSAISAATQAAKRRENEVIAKKTADIEFAKKVAKAKKDAEAGAAEVRAEAAKKVTKVKKDAAAEAAKKDAKAKELANAKAEKKAAETKKKLKKVKEEVKEAKKEAEDAKNKRLHQILSNSLKTVTKLVSIGLQKTPDIIAAVRGDSQLSAAKSGARAPDILETSDDSISDIGSARSLLQAAREEEEAARARISLEQAAQSQSSDILKREIEFKAKLQSPLANLPQSKTAKPFTTLPVQSDYHITPQINRSKRDNMYGNNEQSNVRTSEEDDEACEIFDPNAVDLEEAKYRHWVHDSKDEKLNEDEDEGKDEDEDEDENDD